MFWSSRHLCSAHKLILGDTRAASLLSKCQRTRTVALVCSLHSTQTVRLVWNNYAGEATTSTDVIDVSLASEGPIVEAVDHVCKL